MSLIARIAGQLAQGRQVTFYRDEACRETILRLTTLHNGNEHGIEEAIDDRELALYLHPETAVERVLSRCVSTLDRSLNGFSLAA